jgi:predicted DNA-binding protein with PD1-like motif
MSEKKWVAAVGKPGRILAARIMPGNDAISSMIEVIKENGFKCGTVTAIGSLNSAKVMWAQTTDLEMLRQRKMIAYYTMEGPVDLGLGWGIFGTDKDGSVVLHFHGMIMDKEGNMRCGNLEPGSAPVMATLDLTIQELLDLEIRPILDPILNHKLLNPFSLL